MSLHKSMRRAMRPDTPADRQWRERHYKACKQASDETIAKFWPLQSIEQTKQAIEWQETRIRELMKD